MNQIYTRFGNAVRLVGRKSETETFARRLCDGAFRIYHNSELVSDKSVLDVIEALPLYMSETKARTLAAKV